MIPLLGKSAFMRDIPEEGECEQLAISILRTSNRFYANLDDADICRRLPSDLPSLSFFLAQQLVLDYKEEKLLWNCSSAIERVRKEKELCRESSEMCCQCGQQLTSFTSNERLNLFGGNSVKATFVNRYGNSFNIITTRQLSNYRCISPPSMEDTWFPNYSWRIIQCKKCRHHIGWLFSTRRYWGDFLTFRRRLASSKVLWYYVRCCKVPFNCLNEQTYEKWEIQLTIQENANARIGIVRNPHTFQRVNVNLQSQPNSTPTIK